MTTNTDPLVVCCGLATLDVMQVVDHVPQANEKTVADSCIVEVGGPAANAAATVVALGGRSRLVTGLGSGYIAHLVRDRIDGRGIEVVDLMEDQSGDPALSTVLITASSGDRAVVSTNATHQSNPRPMTGEELDDADVLLVDGHHIDLAIDLARLARAQSIPVVFDGGSWKRGTEELLGHVDVAVVSSNFEPPGHELDVLGYLAAQGCRVAAQTRGERPIELLATGDRRSVSVPGLDSEEIVDTLGAGDVFHGAVAHLLACGQSSPAELLRRASHVAVESCRHRGAVGWSRVPDVVARLRDSLLD